MNSNQKKIQVFGAAVTNDEIEALAELAVKVKKAQKGYKTYVAIYGVLGFIMLFFGAMCIMGNVGAVSYVIFTCALIVLYLVFFGALKSVRLAYRRVAGALNDTNYTPVFGQDGVHLHADDETEQTIPWNEFNAYTRTEHGLWLISERWNVRHAAVYVNGDQTQPALFNDILKNLAANSVKEEITAK